VSTSSTAAICSAPGARRPFARSFNMRGQIGRRLHVRGGTLAASKAVPTKTDVPQQMAAHGCDGRWRRYIQENLRMWSKVKLDSSANNCSLGGEGSLNYITSHHTSTTWTERTEFNTPPFMVSSPITTKDPSVLITPQRRNRRRAVPMRHRSSG